MIKRTKEKVIFKTKLFIIKDVTLETSDGRIVTYQIVEKSDTVLIVPTQGDKIVFVNEYFPAIDAYQLTLPKGSIELGHDELHTVNKELQEEIGYKAAKITKLGALTMSPGYLSQKTHIFLAQELTESKSQGDELEPLEIIEYPFDSFEDLIEDGKLAEARSIAALYLAKKRLSK